MSDLRSILLKLDSLVEGDITQTTLKTGLNKQQKAAHELPALFKPKKIEVLGAKQDPDHPMKGYAVGSNESIETKVTSEDVLSTVKKKLGDYLKSIEDEIRNDPDLKDKANLEIDQIGPAVKTITTDDGHEIKIHGNEDDGFRITVKNKPHSAKFDSIEHAEMACEMYCARRRNQLVVDEDYLDEKK